MGIEISFVVFFVLGLMVAVYVYAAFLYTLPFNYML